MSGKSMVFFGGSVVGLLAGLIISGASARQVRIEGDPTGSAFLRGDLIVSISVDTRNGDLPLQGESTRVDEVMLTEEWVVIHSLHPNPRHVAVPRDRIRYLHVEER